MRIGIKVGSKFEYAFEPLRSVKNNLMEVGIFLTDENTCDLMIVENSIFTQNPEHYIKSCHKLSVFEWSDSAGVNCRVPVRKSLSLEGVAYWLKEFALIDEELNNMPYMNSRYHYMLINEAMKISQPDQTQHHFLDATALSKIRCLFPVGSYKRFEMWIELENKILDLATRKIDVSFAGRITYDHATAELHRRHCIEKISRLSTQSIAVLGPVLDFEQLSNLYLQSKIFISPYGKGEFSWKDWEAVLCGCVVIKPDSSFVATAHHNIYNDGTFIYCKPDFDDLNSVINTILSNIRAFEGHVRLARQRILAHADPDAVFNFFQRELSLMME